MSGPDNGLQLCLFGRFELRAGERLLIDRGWRRTKSKALLKLLGLQQGRALHREQAMELLWPHLEPAAAANQLYKSLHYLRAELARGGVTTRQRAPSRCWGPCCGTIRSRRRPIAC